LGLGDDADEEVDEGDHAEFGSGLGAEEATHPAVQPRWPTRMFAAECVRRLIAVCRTSKPAHFDLSIAKDMQFTKAKGMVLS